MAEKKGLPQYGAYVGAALLVVLIGMFVFKNWGAGGITYYRQVFKMLVQGQQQVARNIDWENLEAMGGDVGATYRQFKTREERNAYTRAFIRQLQLGFYSVGGRYEKFSNWRIQKQDTSTAVVAGDHTGNKRTILLTYTRTGGSWKLSGIQWSSDGTEQEKQDK